MKRLTKLANKYKTDKGTTYWYSHGFADFYEPYFLRYEKPKILEIGTAEGASARMLNDFYDGDCTIYTVDIDPNAGPSVGGMENVHFFNYDMGNEEGIKAFLNEIGDVTFDIIIIDDGSHQWDHQMLCLYFLKNNLKQDGIYVLEDIHTSYVQPENKEHSPLYFLNFFEGCLILYDYEQQELKESIKDIVLFNRYNEKNPDVYNNRSVTAVITLRDRWA